MLSIYLFLITLIVLVLYIVRPSSTKSTIKLCRSTKKLDGKTAIVTGGTTGMGLEIATDFATRGARVIIACPFEKEGLEGLKYIINKTENKDVIFKLLDLSSIQSVRKFPNKILKSEDKLHILVNNAGVYMAEQYITEDGMNSTMQTNYIGHFLLTLLLVPLLKKTGCMSEPSRIVNVTSQAHFKGKIDFRKMNDIKYWSFQIYANSKLCLALFTRELTKKLKRSKYVVVHSADPGYVATLIVKFHNIFLKIMYYLLIKVLHVLFFKSPLEGAQTAIHVALDDEAGAMSGEMFYNCKLTKAAAMVYDEEVARKVWDDSIKLVKLTREEVECVEKGF